MKILIHTDEYYPTAQACSYRMQVFVDIFTAMGDEVTVITSSANKANGSFDSKLHSEKIIYSPTVRMKKKTTIMRILNNFSFSFSSVFSAIRTGKADIVITTSPPPLVSIAGWFIARLKGAKLVYDVRDIWPDVALEMNSFTEDSFFCKVFRAVTGFMYKHADIVTTVSPGKEKKIEAHVINYKGNDDRSKSINNVWLIGNGFDEHVLENKLDTNIIDKYELNKKFTCVYIGNIGLAQGLSSLLDIAAKTRHKEVQFLCFGMGAEKDFLEKRVFEEKLTNVRFCGVVEHAKVFSLLSYSKISFIPLKSSNMKDSVPTKVYEALGIGCPVFLVAEGDSASIIDETGLGVHVSPDKPDLLVRVFDEMIDNYEKFDAHRESTMQLMRNKYSRQRIAINFERKLKELLEK